MTIHTFAGIEKGVKGLDYSIQHMHPDVKKRCLETDVLIIDEISMINAETFDLLHLLACKIKQRDDELFGISDQTIDYLMSRHFEKNENIIVKYTRLFFNIAEVDYYNPMKMNELKDVGRWFHSKDVIKNSKINNTFQILLAIHLKIDAVVMLVRNINVEEKLCNGTVGIITLLENNAVLVNIKGKEVKIELVKADILDFSHSVVASRVGLPLRLAFNFTVHKAQGSTMNKVVLNLSSNAFINSLYYVSLSRVCEDLVEELELNIEIQSLEKIVYHVEQKTLEEYEIEMKNASTFDDLFQKILTGYNIVTLCVKSTEDGYCKI
ncbi:ATP-dependent DNA helicase PIF1-like [Hydra vulgaris]|uniref:ATP-dependent DNA helicase n=1 Tax=Hydra vulgaris TaxID=6087 RepID=A0ABM4DF77_HYDVU